MVRRAAVLATLLALACLHAGAQDTPKPESTVRAFLTAFGSGDIKLAATFVKGVQMSPEGLDEISRQVVKDPATFALTDVKATIDGTNATVTCTVTAKSGKPERSDTLATEVKLVLVGGKWLIAPDAAKARGAGKPDMVNALAYMLTDSKVFTEARDSARAVSCLSNIKQLGLAMMMLSQDYDEKFKLKPETFQKSVMPYVKNKSLFSCPLDNGAGNSYSFNANLAGVAMAKIKAPEKTVMLYEGKNGKLNFRHDGKASVGFADGHAKQVTAAEAKNLRWTP